MSKNINNIKESLEPLYKSLQRVDTKDGRARILITLTDYDTMTVAVDPASTYTTIKIANAYPVNPEGGLKKDMTKFLQLVSQSV